MCGIAGRLFGGQRQGGAAPSDATRAMQRALRHRGPDGEGAFVDDDVSLLHTRLALVDVLGGTQPLQSADGRFVLVVNGEFYGRRRHMAALEARGAKPTTSSDAEVLLWTLALDGQDGLSGLEGEYAFCFWDRQRRRALLGRDVLGVKPLVWARDDDGAVVFASEAQALQRGLARPRAVDVNVVAQTFVCPPLSGREHLPLRGLQSVPAGGVLVVEDDGDGGAAVSHQRRRRHRPLPSPDRAKASAHPQREALLTALREAVRDRCDADADVGVLWSGGLDSTAILALSSGEADTHDLVRHAYSLRFDDDAVARGAGSIVVGDDAAVVAAHVDVLGVRHHWADASQASLLADLDALFRSQDRICAWEQELSQRALARRAALDVKAVLVGDAADETHAGYPFALSLPAVAHPRAFVERFAGPLRASLLRPSLRGAVDDVVDDCLAVAANDDVAFGEGLRAQRRATQAVILERWLPRLLHNGDLHTMAFGLEARVPFADERVLAVAAAIDLDDAFGANNDGADDIEALPEKRVLRAALSGVVPPTIAQRAKSALPRDERSGPAYRRRLREALGAPRRREALASIFDLGAVDAFVGSDAVVDDAERTVLFSLLAIDGFFRFHGGT